MPKPKCEDIDFVHAWEHPATKGINGMGLPRQDESKRYCQNCGRQQSRSLTGIAKGLPGQSDIAVYEWKDSE